MPRVITPEQKRLYWERRDAGYSMRAAAQKAGFSLTTARTLEQKSDGHRQTIAQGKREMGIPEPKRYDELSAAAKRAWNDFGYFQRRYFGRVPMPWQVQAANKVIELLETPDKEYVVVNAPPGSGKTLLFTHDIPAWLVVRNRAIRIQLGSVTGPLAERYSRRLRRSLESVLPLQADDESLADGTAYDAETTLAADFGRFKPLDREQWTAGSFVVMQYADVGAIQEKEATVQSYGIDQGFIGGRFDVVIWDDLVDPRKQTSQEAKERLRLDYNNLCESRLEPKGLLILQGQRLAADDLYRFALDKTIPELVDEDTGEVVASTPKYHHVKFPAHDLSKCNPSVTHKRAAAAWPEGCLLVPTRLNWRELATIQADPLQQYEIVYQQEDVDPESVLVQTDWVYGKGDHPGCIDRNRDRLEIPRGLDLSQGPLFSAITCDPSPTKYWGIEWWVYHQASEQRFLMDLAQVKMDAPDFLDWNVNDACWTGLLEEWWQTSRSIGVPVTHVIVEINAAQRFLRQYDHVRRWETKREVQIVSHSTQRNKSDPDFGVQTIAPHYQFGRVRLPWGTPLAKVLSLKLIKEVTHYPASTTTDLTMAQWFFEFNLQNLYHPDRTPAVQRRPSWIRNPRLFAR